MQPSNVQRDYVFGWLIGGLYEDIGAARQSSPQGPERDAQGLLPRDALL